MNALPTRFPARIPTHIPTPALSRLLAGTGAALLAAVFGSAAWAQAYPSKPITLVVPNPPGGFVDASARILSDSLAKVTSQAVVVDNRGGGSGNVAYQFVARANPDG